MLGVLIIDLLNEKHTQAIKALHKAVDELPLLPSSVNKLIALDSSDVQYFDEVQQLAELDPIFTAKLIAVANSAASSPVTKITSIQHAITRIGADQINGLAAAFAVSKIFIPTQQRELDLWEHSIQVAVAAQSMASMAKSFEINPETAYLCGLLHDIGRFVLFNKIADGPIKIDEKDWGHPEELVALEQQTCGLTHATLGGFAAEKWDLPSAISNAIRNHHNYEYSTTTQKEKKETELLQLVQMADYFSMFLMKNPDLFLLADDDLQQLIEQQCTHPSWEKPPISPQLLRQEAFNIFDKANQTIEGLGIHTNNNVQPEEA